jgi:copper homeostasis protein
MKRPLDEAAGSVLFEVCIDSVASGIAAEAGGAGRVELCDNLVDGGTTPSIGMVKVLRSKIKIPIHVLIRPRGGDFLYSDVEVETMLADIRAMKAECIDGVVIGALRLDGSIDTEITGRLVACARPLRVTFHRAFDVTADAEAALQACLELGVDGILTSGLQPAASESTARSILKMLVRKSAGRCKIMAGGGVTAANVADIVRETGVREVHASAGRLTLTSKMQYRPAQPIYMGAEKQNAPESEFVTRVVSSERVQAYVDVLRGL